MIFLLSQASCSAFPEPTPQALAVADRVECPSFVLQRIRATVRIESPELAGIFDAVILSSPDGPRIHVELFPDLGGKVLNLAAGPDRLAGYLPQRRMGWDHPLDADVRPHFLLLVAITLLEEAAPLHRSRIVGARAEEGGWAFLLKPVVPDSEIVVGVDRAGRILNRRFGYRGARWRLRYEPKETIIMGHSVLVRIEVKERSTEESFAEELFHVKIPAGIQIQDAR